ncbi:MAG TPA: hypothetical protein VMP68_17255 [Candidatus Eisenbacteria bacterium]|nr:hypothetical protein [Candidatus Eisenbacteria bacterium]
MVRTQNHYSAKERIDFARLIVGGLFLAMAQIVVDGVVLWMGPGIKQVINDF